MNNYFLPSGKISRVDRESKTVYVGVQEGNPVGSVIRFIAALSFHDLDRMQGLIHPEVIHECCRAKAEIKEGFKFENGDYIPEDGPIV